MIEKGIRLLVVEKKYAIDSYKTEFWLLIARNGLPFFTSVEKGLDYVLK